MSSLMVRHAGDGFEALVIGQAAYRLDARVVSVCPFDMRKRSHFSPPDPNAEIVGRFLLVWIELPEGVTTDMVDDAVTAHYEAVPKGQGAGK